MTGIEAVEFAARQWGRDIHDDLGMYMNRNHTRYICTENEKYDLIEIFGVPGIFSNERLTKEDIPEDLFLYQLRGSDGECGPFGEIAEYITVNHSGSIVTKEPLDLGEYGSILFNENNAPRFVGDEITIGQLLRGEFRMDMSDEQDDMKLE